MEVRPFDYSENAEEESNANLNVIYYYYKISPSKRVEEEHPFDSSKTNGYNIESLPDEMLTKILSYLDRRERLSCSFVSGRWQRPMNCHSLWEKMSVTLDTDLMEFSTAFLCRKYHHHIRHLTLSWSSQEVPARWAAYRVQDIVKRACRFVIVLKAYGVQLISFKLNNWNEICRFKKLMYLLSLLLSVQTNLRSISFSNAQLHKKDFVRMLISCRSCESTLKHINAHNCFCAINDSILSVQLITCMEVFRNLTTLTLDYTTLCGEILMPLLRMESKSLKSLGIYVHDKEMEKTMSDDHWQMLKFKYPRLKVIIKLDYINSMSISSLFKRDIPLYDLYLCFSTKTSDKSCRDILRLVSYNYKNTLGIYNVNINYSPGCFDYFVFKSILLEIIRLETGNLPVNKDVVAAVLNKCTKLRLIELYGIKYNVFGELLEEQYQRPRNS